MAALSAGGSSLSRGEGVLFLISQTGKKENDFFSMEIGRHLPKLIGAVGRMARSVITLEVGDVRDMLTAMTLHRESVRHVVICGHGEPERIQLGLVKNEDGDLSKANLSKIAMKIQELSITLLSCSTGAGEAPLAAELAKHSGSRVYATTLKVYDNTYYPNLNFPFGSEEPPVLMEGGKFFLPNGEEAKVPTRLKDLKNFPTVENLFMSGLFDNAAESLVGMLLEEGKHWDAKKIANSIVDADVRYALAEMFMRSGERPFAASMFSELGEEKVVAYVIVEAINDGAIAEAETCTVYLKQPKFFGRVMDEFLKKGCVSEVSRLVARSTGHPQFSEIINQLYKRGHKEIAEEFMIKHGLDEQLIAFCLRVAERNELASFPKLFLAIKDEEKRVRLIILLSQRKKREVVQTLLPFVGSEPHLMKIATALLLDRLFYESFLTTCRVKNDEFLELQFKVFLGKGFGQCLLTIASLIEGIEGKKAVIDGFFTKELFGELRAFLDQEKRPILDEYFVRKAYEAGLSRHVRVVFNRLPPAIREKIREEMQCKGIGGPMKRVGRSEEVLESGKREPS